MFNFQRVIMYHSKFKTNKPFLITTSIATQHNNAYITSTTNKPVNVTPNSLTYQQRSNLKGSSLSKLFATAAILGVELFDSHGGFSLAKT